MSEEIAYPLMLSARTLLEIFLAGVVSPTERSLKYTELGQVNYQLAHWDILAHKAACKNHPSYVWSEPSVPLNDLLAAESEYYSLVRKCLNVDDECNSEMTAKVVAMKAMEASDIRIKLYKQM